MDGMGAQAREAPRIELTAPRLFKHNFHNISLATFGFDSEGSLRHHTRRRHAFAPGSGGPSGGHNGSPVESGHLQRRRRAGRGRLWNRPTSDYAVVAGGSGRIDLPKN